MNLVITQSHRSLGDFTDGLHIVDRNFEQFVILKKIYVNIRIFLQCAFIVLK